MLSIDILKSAPTRSILLMNAMHVTSYFVACRQTVSVYDCTSAFASITMGNDSYVPRSIEGQRANGRVRVLRAGLLLFVRLSHTRDHRKCAIARFARAILCVSSRLLMVLPLLVAASFSSCARASA